MIAFTKEERRPLAYSPDRIAIMDLNGKNLRLLSEDLDGDASNLIWADDSQSIYYTYDERGIRKIGRAISKVNSAM